MASNLLELRRAAGYRSAGDFAEAHKIPASTYARYESNPDKIPLRAAWQLADVLDTTIDAIVGREAQASDAARGEVQLEYESLTPEARSLMDEFRKFVLAKDIKIKKHKRKEEKRLYEALCYQYEQQMLSEMRNTAPFGELIAFESAAEARKAFLDYLQKQAARKRSKLATRAQKVVDNQIIEKIMAAYDQFHGEFEDASIIWSSVDHRADTEYNSAIEIPGGDAGTQ